MSELRELYQDLILDHNRRPRNFQKLAGANRTAEGYNPLCGDRVTVYLRLEDGVVRDVGFQGSGCAIATAAASMMSESVKGKTAAEAAALFKTFHTMVTGDLGATGDPVDLGKLAAFAGVREFPIRVKCATLAWHTLRAALEEKAETCSTE
jgi:nitrogen fixation NifU-like protein